jgi:hypothetical protein
MAKKQDSGFFGYAASYGVIALLLAPVLLIVAMVFRMVGY